MSISNRHRTPKGRCVPWATMIALAATLFAPVSHAADSGGLHFSISNDWNRVFDPAPATIPGVSDYQAKSIAIFNGNVGPAGNTNTPNDGSLFLVRSALGHALGPISAADFFFGEQIVPEPTLAVDKTIAPIIEPASKAFMVTNALNPNDEGKLFASEPGFVNITWFQTNGTPVPVRYLISDRPVRSPVGMYHTHNPGSSLLTNSPTASPQPPPVDLGSVAVTIFHWNTAIPENASDPFLLRSVNTLFAKEKIGLILIEYRNQQGKFLDFEIASVRRSDQADALSLVDIGDELSPNEDALSLAERPSVSRGLGLTGGDVFVYQHNSAGSPQDGDVFAIRKSLHPLGEDIEVYWRRRGVQNVVWSYELHRYQADWPTNNPAKYQLYARGTPPAIGPNVDVSSVNAQVMPFQEPAAHARMETPTRFISDVPGFSLLKYTPGNGVAFQVVRSVSHHDTAFFNLAPLASSIGVEITEATHRGPRPGYIHLPEGARYDWEIYDGNSNDPPEFRTGQIFPINTGILEIWWANTNKGVQWPSLVKRYDNGWPQQPEKIIIASTIGSGVINAATHKNFRFYSQNDSSQPGFNPNDEHALIAPFDTGEALFALRNDLGTPGTSEPYVLLKFQVSAQNDRWRFRIFQVVAEQSPFFFQYPARAGTPIQPPFPLSRFQTPTNSAGVSGPYFRDRKAAFWAKAAGDNGGPTNIVMRFFYKLQTGFFFPGPNPPAVGAEVAWLDLHAGTPGIPQNVGYTVTWPDNVPQLQLGETLVKPKHGLPGVGAMLSAEIIYQQSASNGLGASVKLIDPTRIRQVDLAQPPGDVQTSQSQGLTFFPTLPPHLRTNFWYDPLEHKLKFIGSFIEPVAGEYFLRLNVITARERQVLLNLSHEPNFVGAVTALSASAAQATEVPPHTPFNKPLALTAGGAQGVGFVTIAENNSTNLNLNPDAAPVALHIVRVTCPLYQGELKVVLSENPLDEKITLRHSGDFAGKVDDYIFEWRTEPPVNGLPSTKPFDQWSLFVPSPASGDGAADITIEGASLFTLSDNYFVCRYRPKDTNNPCGGAFSSFTSPQLQEGWIKRVLTGINPFEQRIHDYENTAINTIVSMISQAGPRFVGNVALNLESVNNSGLIETYETVLRRGIDLSIEGSPPVSYPPANDALLLVAGRLADLYMLLGNEAFADASDPTIAFGTESQFGAEASSIHCFMNQTASLIDEELALLRGRDDRLPPGVAVHPFYNRLVWNFTGDINGGEVAYALNYNVRDELGAVDGTINEADAKRLYPQGHGDAWGHYLMAIKNYYRLLRSPDFTWVPRSEAVLVGGVPVAVDFLDERKFAKAAAAKARTGAEITSLTYRSVYVEDPAGQWQGYQDADTNRAWGVSEWSSRAGQGALFDWVVGNALLPHVDPNPSHAGIQKIDRTTVTELREIPAAFDEIQSEADKADVGLNPLGLTRNSIPFDINPAEIDQQKTHFEQIRDRAVRAMNNAIAVFNHANNSTQLLRRQADVQSDFQQKVVEREADFNNRLIEIFGTPYPDDIGPSGTYPSGYNGPDLFHYDYVDVFELAGVTPSTSQTFTQRFVDLQVNPLNGALNTNNTINVSFDLASDRLNFVKPASWTSPRRSPGAIQRSLSELLQTRVRFEKGLKEYDLLVGQIQDQADAILEQNGVNARELLLVNTLSNKAETVSDSIKTSRALQLGLRTGAKLAGLVADAKAESLPTITGIASDVTSVGRGGIKLAGAAVAFQLELTADVTALAELSEARDLERTKSLTDVKITALRQGLALTQAVERLEQVVRQELLTRMELYNLYEALQQAAGGYRSTLARGMSLLEDRLRFRQQTAAQVQAFRYKDMAFRIFRNDALQKYRAQFDLAAMYVFLAAKAYDFETALAPGDPRGPGEAFMTSIIRSRSLGLIQNNLPETGGAGDPGLADPLARMFSNWDLNLKGQLGFNNPDILTVTLSLRNQLFRIADGAAGLPVWRQTLASRIVPDYRDIPEVRRYCDLPLPDITEPAIVIQNGANDQSFSTTVTYLLNVFGWPLGPGDFGFNPTMSATKIRGVRVIFSGYTVSGTNALACSPYVYLIPVGEDVLRSPDVGTPRQWKILDQQLPVPFPLSAGNPGGLNWIPLNDTLGNNLAAIRKFDLFLAGISPQPASCPAVGFTGSSRLIGRSIWNTKWMLIIPAGGLGGSTLDEGLRRFINTVADISIEFRTYSYGGN